MAKKDIYTCDPDKISINTFSSKQKSFTAANNNYKGSYLNTAGNQTVKKLNSTVSSYYQQLDSLYNSIIKYISNYIRSVKNLEKSLQSGSLSEEEEIEVRATINAVNEILNGTEPSDIVINPLTGEVSVNYDSSKYRQYNIDPKMNGSLTSESTKIANRDALYGAHITNPKLMTFLDAWTLVPFEVGSVEKYTQEQSQKIQEIKGKNVGANILGTAAGVLTFAVIPGMSAEGAFSKLAIQTGAKSIAKAECKNGLSKLLLSVGKQELIDAPMNLSMAFKEAYDMNTGKINWGTFVKSMGLNVGFDLGFRGIGSLGKRIINAKSVKMGLENIDELIDVKKGISTTSNAIDNVDGLVNVKKVVSTTSSVIDNVDGSAKTLVSDLANTNLTNKIIQNADSPVKFKSYTDWINKAESIRENWEKISNANNGLPKKLVQNYTGENNILDAGNYQMVNGILRNSCFDFTNKTITLYGTAGNKIVYTFSEFEKTYGVSAKEVFNRQYKAALDLHDAIIQNPIGARTEFVRGINIDALNKYGIELKDGPEEVLQKLKAAGKYEEKGFMSVCPSTPERHLPYIAASKDYRLILDVNGSTGAIDLSNINYSEHEVLLENGLVFEPINCEEIDDKIFIYLKQI